MNRSNIRIIQFLFFLIISLLTLSSCTFNEDIVSLNPDWQFYWDQLLTPEDFAENLSTLGTFDESLKLSPDPTAMLNLPGSWNAIDVNDYRIGYAGVATYRIVIALPESSIDTQMALRIEEIRSAYRVWIDGKLMMEKGNVDRTPGPLTYDLSPEVVPFIPNSSSVEIIIQVANYHYHRGGIVRPIRMGGMQDVYRLDRIQKSRDTAIFAVIVVIGLYHLGFFLIRKQGVERLFFLLFCMVIALRIPLVGERIIADYFLSLNWFIIYKISLSVFYLSPLFLLLFLSRTFPLERKWHRMERLLLILCLIFTGITLITPFSGIRILFFCYYISFGYFAVIIGYTFIILLRAVKRKRDGGTILVIGLAVAITVGILEIFSSLFLISSGSFLGFGILALLLAEIGLHKKFILAQQRLRMQQEQLVQAEKLSTLGILVSGIGHEIKNPCTSITSSAEVLEENLTGLNPYLREYLPKDTRIGGGKYSLQELISANRSSIDTIRRNTDRIRTITDDIKTLAKSSDDHSREPIDLNSVVKDAITLIEFKIRNHTRVFKVRYSPSLPLVSGNYQRLEQLVINLILNACEALDTLDQPVFVNLRLSKDRKSIIFSVTDKGKGIPPELVESIFTPFFTSKADQGGTGLGLFISDKIVQNHGGELKISSEPGEGTRIDVILPI